ncbi:hypothetical protein [Streptomyces griseorubiginosus]
MLALYADGLIGARDHDAETGLALLRHTLNETPRDPRRRNGRRPIRCPQH